MNEWLAKMAHWITQNQLVTVQYTEKRKGPISFSGRLLQVNEDQLLFYADDKKEVINIHINQIDQIEPFE